MFVGLAIVAGVSRVCIAISLTKFVRALSLGRKNAPVKVVLGLVALASIKLVPIRTIVFYSNNKFMARAPEFEGIIGPER